MAEVSYEGQRFWVDRLQFSEAQYNRIWKKCVHGKPTGIKRLYVYIYVYIRQKIVRQERFVNDEHNSDHND